MNTNSDKVFRARRVITPTGEVAASVVVHDGRIAEITPYDAPHAAGEIIDVPDDSALLPGLVDSHVHVNEPGRTAWEGFATATRAAVAGGITTLIDMPLNSIPATVDIAALREKQDVAAGQCSIDVGFWGGAVGDNLGDMAELARAGVFGFKAFLLPSGVEEFCHLDAAQLEAAVRAVAELDSLLIVHAEDPAVIDAAPAPHGPIYADFLASRPVEAETRAIAALIDLAERYGARVHVLHLAAACAVPMIAAARARGVRITAETCPHYLTISAEEIPDGATEFKCCPPIRNRVNQQGLWNGLRDNVIDCIVSDHSPSTVELKRAGGGDFGKAWGGIAGLQVGLSAIWTASPDWVGLPDLVRWMATGPADLAGLEHKGRIAIGADADFCVFAPHEEFVVDATALQHRNPISAYDGRTLRGVVRSTWLRGDLITGDHARGRLLQREG
ncbi:allantoinase AllB [Nocardia sp. NEAU-G5]|uniref:allantoinase n=1 Tax=Nocardia albiluteola TaxID=2842303 RepID=A0ABS6AXM7_9NOCA|nr:allantoinase AllB [Nocardia albiluteola]MBU3062633.1 allantoinase AllB [Nocardia albiluteola]MBU3065533.1 allantoinase AllB [Nocardia albiluteola]